MNSRGAILHEFMFDMLGGLTISHGSMDSSDPDSNLILHPLSTHLSVSLENLTSNSRSDQGNMLATDQYLIMIVAILAMLRSQYQGLTPINVLQHILGNYYVSSLQSHSSNSRVSGRMTFRHQSRRQRSSIRFNIDGREEIRFTVSRGRSREVLILVRSRSERLFLEKREESAHNIQDIPAHRRHYDDDDEGPASAMNTGANNSSSATTVEMYPAARNEQSSQNNHNSSSGSGQRRQSHRLFQEVIKIWTSFSIQAQKRNPSLEISQ